MSRRSSKNSRRFGESGGIGALFGFNSLSRSSPYFPIALILLGAVFLFVYLYSSSAQFGGNRQALNRVQGDFSCTVEVREAIPILKKAYGDSMHKVLHIGPNTCYVVSRLLKEEETEAWGVEPYDIEDADGNCKALVRRGIVRVADIKFPLPYRPKSFSLVIVSDAVDYLSPKYLNKTIPDLARVSADGLVIFTGLPGQHRAKVAEVTKFGRAVSDLILGSESVPGSLHVVCVLELHEMAAHSHNFHVRDEFLRLCYITYHGLKNILWKLDQITNSTFLA